MTITPNSATHPWILGSFAVYADNLLVARQVYECLSVDAAASRHFGTVTLESGEKVDWVNFRYGLLQENRAC